MKNLRSVRENRAGRKYVLYFLRCDAWELQPAGKTDCTVSG